MIAILVITAFHSHAAWPPRRIHVDLLSRLSLAELWPWQAEPAVLNRMWNECGASFLDFNAGDATVTVNIADLPALWSVIDPRFAEKRGFSLATLNLDHLVKLARSQSFAKAYAAQDFVVADGNPIVWLSKLAGRPVSLMPGSDLVVPLAQRAAQAGVGVALLGSTPEALAASAQALERAAPGLCVVSQIAPPFGFDPEGDEAKAILAELATSGAGLCFLALGAPKQEQLAALGRSLAPSVGFVSIGAGLDFLAGTQKRAPQIIRTLALEWAWRLATNPMRMFARYASCAAILPGQAVAALRQRLRR